MGVAVPDPDDVAADTADESSALMQAEPKSASKQAGRKQAASQASQQKSAEPGSKAAASLQDDAKAVYGERWDLLSPLPIDRAPSQPAPQALHWARCD